MSLTSTSDFHTTKKNGNGKLRSAPLIIDLTLFRFVARSLEIDACCVSLQEMYSLHEVIKEGEQNTCCPCFTSNSTW